MSGYLKTLSRLSWCLNRKIYTQDKRFALSDSDSDKTLTLDIVCEVCSSLVKSEDEFCAVPGDCPVLIPLVTTVLTKDMSIGQSPGTAQNSSSH